MAIYRRTLAQNMLSKVTIDCVQTFRIWLGYFCICHHSNLDQETTMSHKAGESRQSKSLLKWPQQGTNICNH